MAPESSSGAPRVDGDGEQHRIANRMHRMANYHGGQRAANMETTSVSVCVFK